MKYVRWYDKDPYLSEMMRILEQLPIEIRNDIAQDLLQIVMDTQKSNDDSKIEYLKNNLLPEYRRWYDENPNLLSSVEILKDSDEATKKEACESVMEYLFQILTKEQAKING